MKKIHLYTPAIKSAIMAGDEILKIYNLDSFDIESKSDNSPLTKADLASNTIINKELEKTGIPIISEENKEIDYQVRKNWERCWIVDPLDGTKEFIKKNGEFTVNIALLEKGKPIYGVIYVPVSKELYMGDVEQGESYKMVVEKNTFLDYNNLKDEFQIHPKKFEKGSYEVVGSRSHMNSDTEEFIQELKKKYNKVEIVSKGSSLKFCLMAEGLADIYPRFAPTMEWDTAAGHAICNAVGLKVISSVTGDELSYNKENLLNEYFVVKN